MLTIPSLCAPHWCLYHRAGSSAVSETRGWKRKVIAYASRTLNKSEWNYDAHKLEFLALKWAITDRFHEYLYGATFDVYTDNNPLTYILSTAKLDAMGHRWVASLGPYNFTLHYKPGKLNCNADALSHINWQSVSPEIIKATMDLAQVDRTLILDPEIRGQKPADAPLWWSPWSWVMQQEMATSTEWRSRNQENHSTATRGEWSTYKYSKNELDSMKSYVKVRQT